MILVNRKNNRITGAIEGIPFNILFDMNKFETLKILSGRLDKTTGNDSYVSIVKTAREIIQVDYKEEIASVNGYLKYKPHTGQYHLVINKGKKTEKVSCTPLPEILTERIVESYEENSDYMPILLAWRRFLAKHAHNKENCELFANYLTAMFINKEHKKQFIEEHGYTEEQATLSSTYNDIAITNYGILATYKVVDVVKKIWELSKDKEGNEIKKQIDAFPITKVIDKVTGKVTKTLNSPAYLEEITFTPAIHKNGDEFTCGSELGYKYKIGQEHILPENAKRNYDNTFGGGGLYFGGQAYIEGYSKPQTEILTCFVDPYDIISFQSDGLAFRADRCFINGTMMEGELEGMYFISDYAKESDSRITTQFKKLLEKESEILKKSKKEIDESTCLLKDIIDGK